MSRDERYGYFLAHLTARYNAAGGDDLQGIQNVDFDLYGLWILRYAFEAHDASQVDTTGLVRIAVPWITEAGNVLWDRTQRNVDMDERRGWPGPKFRDSKDWKGFNKGLG